ncbi:hypothetical protein [Myxacorys almedinensis]|nr:hypothetical protein [Myxacorys almedinensis]
MASFATVGTSILSESTQILWLHQMDGQQPGDPQKAAAAAMIQVVNHPNPPLRLVLGADMLEVIHAKLGTVAADLADWKDVSIDTAFEGVAVSVISG